MSNRSYIVVSENVTACNSLALGGCPPTCFQSVNTPAVSACTAYSLCGCVPSCFLGATATATNSLALCGCTPACFLGATATAVSANTATNSLALCGCIPSCFLGATATANCATTAGNALALCGCIPSCFLGATATANNSTCLNGQLASYYQPASTAINTGNIASQSVSYAATAGSAPANGGTANNSTCLNGQLASYYQVASTAINTGNIASQSVSYATTAGNSSCLGGNPACYYLFGVNGSGSQQACASIYCPYEISQYKSGFWETTSAVWTPSTDWYWGLTAAHASNNGTPGYNYSMNIIGKGTGTGTGCDYYIRTVAAGSACTWRKIATQDSNLQLDAPSNGGNGGYISSGNHGGTGCAAWMPAGVYAVSNSWIYGTLTTNGAVCNNAACWCIGAAGAATFVGGVTTPTLVASGTLSVCGGNSNNIALYTNSAYVLLGTASSCTSLYFSGAEKFKTLTNGSCTCGCTWATDFVLSSDASLKTNIAPIEISPVNVEYRQFNFKSDDVRLRYGVIAQELQESNPELVSVDDDGLLSVSYTDLLVKEIAYLKCRVFELEKKIM